LTLFTLNHPINKPQVSIETNSNGSRWLRLKILYQLHNHTLSLGKKKEDIYLVCGLDWNNRPSPEQGIQTVLADQQNDKVISECGLFINTAFDTRPIWKLISLLYNQYLQPYLRYL